MEFIAQLVFVKYMGYEFEWIYHIVPYCLKKNIPFGEEVEKDLLCVLKFLEGFIVLHNSQNKRNVRRPFLKISSLFIVMHCDNVAREKNMKINSTFDN